MFITKTKQSGLRLLPVISASVQRKRCKLFHIGESGREKGMALKRPVTEVPPALWKSNYCDNIHSNQATDEN